MARSSSTTMSLPDFGKPLLLFASFVLSLPAIWERVVTLDDPAAIGAYIGLLALMWTGVVGAAWSRFLINRILWAVLLPGGLILMESYRFASGQFMTYDAFITMLASSGSASDALRQNIGAVFAAGVPAIILILGTVVPPRPRLPLPWGITMFFAPLALVVLTGVLFARGGDGGRGLPPGMTTVSYFALAGYENATNDFGPRKEPLFAPAAKPAVRNLVLIIDESIAPAYLAANDPGGVATPLSAPPEGIASHNFGIAAAVTNCSVGSNATLRYGGTRDDYRRMIAEFPSLWAYARQAGMRTVYLDAQTADGSLQNGMDEAERAQIDEFVQFADAPIIDRDMRVAAKIAELTRQPGAKFIIVNKLGAHFPIHDKYPDSATAHRPALHRGQFTGIAHTGSRVGFGGTAEEWRLYRNSYRNTLGWNVGEFFNRLLAEGDFSDTLMVYTADHGQDLHEDGRGGTTTHCMADPRMSEGVAPLFVIEGIGEDGETASGKNWSLAARTNHNKASHFMIAPTLLAAMGYDPRKVQGVYGNSLSQPSRDPGTFLRNFNARLGQEPEWRKVDPVSLPKPPKSD